MEIEKTTPGGYLIKIRMEKLTYTVFKDNVPEVPSGAKDRSIICAIPHFIFVGEGFDIKHFSPSINYVPVEKRRLTVPYRHNMHKGLRNISVFAGSLSDLLPIKVTQLVNTGEILEYLELADSKVLVVDDDFPRFDLVQIKMKYPRLRILIVKKKIQADEKEIPVGSEAAESPGSENGDAQVIDETKIRAADAINDKNINLMSKNPVFLSRVHLRNLELDKVKQILFDFPLTQEDCTFIGSFLSTMLKKKTDELVVLHPKLESLKLAYDFYPMLIEREGERIEEFLAGEVPSEAASIIWMLILAQKEEAKDKDDEVQLWEWELKIRKHT